MRIEVTIAKTSPLPAGAIDALASELSRRIQYAYPDIDSKVSVRYAVANNYRLLVLPKKTNHALAQSCKKRGKALMIGF